MRLIQQLKRASTFGFSTSIRLTQKLTVSSIEELLKSWVLLDNYGHLIDTLEAERVWFELLLEEPKLYQTLIDCMPDKTCKEFAEDISREERLYQFHHLTALAFLRWLREKRGESKTSFDLRIEMVKALLRKNLEATSPREGSKLDRALTAFNTLRRASYVLLDINRSALFLRIDSNNLLRNILSNPDVVLYKPDSEANRMQEYRWLPKSPYYKD